MQTPKGAGISSAWTGLKTNPDVIGVAKALTSIFQEIDADLQDEQPPRRLKDLKLKAGSDNGSENLGPDRMDSVPAVHIMNWASAAREGCWGGCEHLYLATWDGQVRCIPSQAPYKLVGGARKGCCPSARGSHQDVRAAAHPSWPSP
eukprot:COSAG01_NODE_202_length_22130_cov_167.927239_6_plen_147_part_00